jgi:lysophospholipase L1-like esterase
MKIILMGDSTMQTNDASTYPQVGWGQMLSLFFKSDVQIMNFAKNGCSTKSFYDLGFFNKALAEVEAGTYCLIQFGHNDQKVDNPLRYTDKDTTYKTNLSFYIDEIRQRKGIPVLLTSVYRRYFDDHQRIMDDVHQGYPEAMMEVAWQESVLILDICQLSKDLLTRLGDDSSKRLFMIFPPGLYEHYPQGMNDNTHLRSDGAFLIAKMVVDELERINHPLKKYLL